MGITTKKSLDEWKNIIKINHPEIEIIKEFDKDKFLCVCHNCGQKIYKLKKKIRQGCSICTNKQLCIGVNDLNTTANWMVKYLKDKNDAFKYMKSSSKKILFKCTDCGYEKMLKINNVYNHGFSCPICGDKISKPNKFTRALLLQLPLENLQFEYSSEWTNKKRYDAYFEYKNKKYVIEVDGDQHFTNSEWSSVEKQQINDKEKNLLAKENNVKIIRIPFLYKYELNDIKHEFEKSVLIGDLISKSNINWNLCIQASVNNILKEVCEYYNNHPNLSTMDLGKIFKLSYITIRNYLKKGTDFGWCKYSSKEAKINAMNKAVKYKKNKIEVRDSNNKLIEIYKDVEDCTNSMNKLYKDKNFTLYGIQNACLWMLPYKGFLFNYENMTLEQKYENDEMFRKVCDYYNSHENIVFSYELVDILNISVERILKYLKCGERLGVCRYSQKEVNNKRNLKGLSISRNKKCTKVALLDSNNNVVCKYESLSECARELKKKYNNLRFNRKKLKKLLLEKNSCEYQNFKFALI